MTDSTVSRRFRPGTFSDPLTEVPRGAAIEAAQSIGLEPVPEKCGRFSDKDILKIKGIEHFR